MQHGVFYDLMHHLKSIGLGGVIKSREEEDRSANQSITTVFVEQLLA